MHIFRKITCVISCIILLRAAATRANDSIIKTDNDRPDVRCLQDDALYASLAFKGTSIYCGTVVSKDVGPTLGSTVETGTLKFYVSTTLYGSKISNLTLPYHRTVDVQKSALDQIWPDYVFDIPSKETCIVVVRNARDGDQEPLPDGAVSYIFGSHAAARQMVDFLSKKDRLPTGDVETLYAASLSDASQDVRRYCEDGLIDLLSTHPSAEAGKPFLKLFTDEHSDKLERRDELQHVADKLGSIAGDANLNEKSRLAALKTLSTGCADTTSGTQALLLTKLAETVSTVSFSTPELSVTRGPAFEAPISASVVLNPDERAIIIKSAKVANIPNVVREIVVGWIAKSN